MYKFLYSILFLISACYTFGQTPLFSPGLTVFGGFNDGTDFIEGTITNGFTGNAWPAAESPDHAIDGVGDKYLNFEGINTGLVVSIGLVPQCICSVKLWTANDEESRDPASIEIYGSNTAFAGGSSPMSNYSLVFSSPLNLPSTRNQGGNAALDDINSQVLNFPTSPTCFTNYLITFPTTKSMSSATFMQIAEIQLFTCTDCIPVKPIVLSN